MDIEVEDNKEFISNTPRMRGEVLIVLEESRSVVIDRAGPRHFGHVQNNRGAMAIHYVFFSS